MNNPLDMVSQALKLKDKLTHAKEAASQKMTIGLAGADMVKINFKGSQAQSIEIDPELFNEKPIILQELITHAINDGLRKIEEQSKLNSQQLIQGLGLPGNFDLSNLTKFL